MRIFEGERERERERERKEAAGGWRKFLNDGPRKLYYSADSVKVRYGQNFSREI